MKFRLAVTIVSLLFSGVLGMVRAQQPDSSWTLQKCIDYALQQNIQVRKSVLNTENYRLTAEQRKAQRFPSLSASVNQSFAWRRNLDLQNQYGSYSGDNGTNYGVSSDVILYSGGRLNKNIQQSSLNYQASQYDAETQKENISLSVMNAYLQVLYAEEQVKNSERQVEATAEQLRLAGERVRLGAISNADYLQVKSELASEKLTLANAQNLLSINKVNLEQLLELPVTPGFSIVHPQFGDSINQRRVPDAQQIYETALNIKPQIKSAQINRQSAQVGIDIARSGYSPQLTASGDISTAYSSLSGTAYDYQVKNRIVPSVGLNLSIPIFQNKQVRTNVELAKINTQTADLNLTDTQNQLRKSIEQAVTDVISAEKEYDATMEQWSAANESFNVATEKFNNGLMNSVDYLIQKTNLITAENNLLQSKYNLIFNYKILDFYTGNPLTL